MSPGNNRYDLVAQEVSAPLSGDSLNLIAGTKRLRHPRPKVSGSGREVRDKLLLAYVNVPFPESGSLEAVDELPKGRFCSVLVAIGRHETSELFGHQAREVDADMIIVFRTDGLEANRKTFTRQARGKHRAR